MKLIDLAFQLAGGLALARVHGQASHFVWTNRSKESLTLDLKQPEAQAILARLIGRADVLVAVAAGAAGAGTRPSSAAGPRAPRPRTRSRSTTRAAKW